jgi:branched-chain amino acid transport system permease protein
MRKALSSVQPATIMLAVAALVVWIGIPLITDSFQTFQFANVAAFVIAIIGLNLLTGYSGQISLGNGAFMAVGGYTTALMAHRLGAPFILTVPLGALLAGLFGFLIGIPALRLRGIYLALATFALALSVTPVLNNFDTFTGGHAGINLKPVVAPFGVDLSNEQWLYFTCWAVAAIMFIPARLLLRSRTGRAWMAIRESETAAVANGVNVAFYKTLAFGISAFYAGVAGSLQIITTAYVNPDNYTLGLSLSLLIGLVIGGLGSIWGPVLGGILVVWLPYFAEKASGVHLGPISLGGKPDVGFGLLLILIVFFAPDGLAGLFRRGIVRYRRVRGTFRAEQAEPEPLLASDSVGTPAMVEEPTMAEADQIRT